MFKNNNKVIIWSVLAAVVLITITALFGVGSDSTRSVENKNMLWQAVYNYFERMPEDMYKIPEAELKKLVDSNSQDIYIIDIRSNVDFAKGHIPNSHNIPFKDVGKNLDKLPQDKTIIVYCYTGQTGGQTTALLNIAGFKARSLNGGMNNGWLKSGYSVVTD